jgi:triosephosphate isomerase
MKRYIFGNWKMSQFRTPGIEFVSRWTFQDPNVEAAVFPNFLHLAECVRERKAGLQIGAQDCSPEMEGAFTGEVSARMLAELGVQYCLVGHSERRIRFQESNALLAQKIRQLSLVGVSPVFCLGENLEERKSGRVFEVLSQQLEAISALPQSVIVAYEPVWAIGTGVIAEDAQIKEVHAFLRQKLPSQPLLYGGSVKPENAGPILKIDHVNGLLVGGASLRPESFEGICRLACA